jgi:epoxyqueuosine reductase
MDAARRASLLKTWALEAGFDRAGVARLRTSEQGAAFRSWVARGDHAGMGWLGRGIESRLDPARVLPGARSALCVAIDYHPLAAAEEPEGDLWPRVARYARGRDYHEVMSARLAAVEERIARAFPGTATRRYVDTGPLLEREIAARAGLGILMSLDLAPDPPVADLCGRCTRCLDLCPTGALPEPYRLDANRCISYWTIEHRGDLPPEAREWLGEWVFGCDVCQEVCPWNVRREVRGAAEGRTPADHPELRLPSERRELDLAGLLRLSRDEYVERFRGSPMKRAKLEGLQRNAAVAMGNRGDARYAASLAEALATGGPMLRRHAAWALGRIGTTEARAALERALETEEDASVMEEIREALRAPPRG